LSLSVVMPAWNECANLEPAVLNVNAVLDAHAPDSDIIIVDDGSRDGTAEIARALQTRLERVVHVVSHAGNRGYGAAIRAGIAQCRRDLVVLLPADRQYDARDLPRLLESAQTYDIVVGRRVGNADPMIRRVNRWCWRRLVCWLFELPLIDVNSGFKIYRRRLFDECPLRATGAMFDTEILARATCRGATLVEVPVQYLPRRGGRASGGRLAVIARSVRELVALYPELRARSGGCSGT
jgi:glycosyltransferase involved in cell wall biosynthesis